MALEWLAIPCVMLAAALVPKGKGNDKKKIDSIFKNVGYGIRNKNGDVSYPKFKKKVPLDNAVEYWYSVPLGLPASKMSETERKGSIFADGLKRPVKIRYEEGYLKVKIYTKGLPGINKEGKPELTYSSLPKLKEEWVAPIGMSLDGMVWRDFDAIPHMIVAGTTRFGKTVALKLLITYLIENHPDDIEVYIIDLKGGLEFSRYENLKQVKGVASNVQEAYDLLFSLANSQKSVTIGKGKEKRVIELKLGKMIEEYGVFKKNKWSNIVDTTIKKRTFVIVDEAAQLTPEKFMSDDVKGMMGACQSYLSEIARLGGALGYREIFCTQYPTSDTLPRQIKMTSDVKMTFRLGTGYASGVAIDEEGAEMLPTDLKGRALYKTHEVNEIQVPYISDDEMFSRLNKYQETVIWEGEAENVIDVEETEKSGGNPVNDPDARVCEQEPVTRNTRIEI